MQSSKVTASIVFVAMCQSACIGALGGGSSQTPNPLFALLFGAISNEPTNPTPAPIDASSEPVIEGMSSLADSFEVVDSSVAVPQVLPGNHVPVGRVYEADLKWGDVTFTGETPTSSEVQTITFPEPVTLTYVYDAAALASAGFLEEFQVWYYDKSLGEWRVVDQVSVDPETQTVKAITNHFTPFVLTALPTPTGTGVAAGPSCMTAEFPVGGSGGAQWSVFDSGFKYYLDRNYTINLTPELQALGFERALGIATCNGGSPHAGFNPCGTFDEHKRNNQPNYISFTAPADIDVFVMYDSRGPSDAPWLASRGFTDSGVRIATTDPVNQYKVYRRSYTRNSTVTLDGNRHGIAGATNIDTNYWVVIRPQGIPGFVEPSAFCQNPTASDNPPRVEALHAIPGANRVTLFWTNPADQSVTNVLLRRDIGIPTLSPSGGVAPTGTERSTEVYADQALLTAQTYFYTMFSLTANGSYSPAKVIEASTGVDTDGDGIKDAYEVDPDHTYASGLRSNHLLADSDGDGTDDLEEIINGTDPTNPDATPPTITGFNLTSPASTTIPTVVFQLTAADNVAVTGYLVKTNNQRPRPNDPGWQSASPGALELSAAGTHQLYAFVKDAAGNITGPAGPLTVEITAMRFPRAVYVGNTAQGGISIYRPDLATGGLTFWKTVPGNAAYAQLLVHPNGRFLYASHEGETRVFTINPADGDLSLIQTVTGLWSLSFDSANSLVGGATSQHYRRYTIGADGRLTYSGAVQYDTFRGGAVWGNPTTGTTYANIEDRGTKVWNSSFTQLQYLSNSGGAFDGRQAVHPSGRFAYIIAGGLHLLRLDNSGLISTEDPLASTLMAWDAVITADGQVLYALITVNGTPARGYVEAFSINQSNGALTTIGRIGPLDGLLEGDLSLDRTENFLYVAKGSYIHSLRLDPTTRLPTAIVSRNAIGNAAGQIAVHTHWEGNAGPHYSLASSSMHLYRGGPTVEPVFQGYTPRNWLNVSGRSWDPDMALCDGRPENTVTSAELLDAADNPLPLFVWHWPTPMFASFRSHASMTGRIRLRVRFTDDPGSCSGGAQTASTELELRTARYTSGPLTKLAAFPAAEESPTRRFHMLSAASAGHSNRRPLSFTRVTCRFSGLHCGPDFNGNYIRCEPFEDVRAFETSEFRRDLQHCGHVFPPPNPLQAFFLQYRVDEISRENLIGGYWYEVFPD